LLLSWGAGAKCEPSLDVAADDISGQEIDDFETEQTIMEEGVEWSRKKNQAALSLVLLAMFVLVIVLLLWRGVVSTSAVMTMRE
jgi:hypothetical protein